MRRRGPSMMALALVVSVFVAPSAAGQQAPFEHEGGFEPAGFGPTDLSPPEPFLLGEEPIDPFEWDPNRIIGAEWVQTYTLGTDRLEVWICDSGGDPLTMTLDEAVDVLEEWVTPYYQEISRGHYTPSFIPAGWLSAPDQYACIDGVMLAASLDALESDGAFVIATNFEVGGFAQVDRACEGDGCFFPANERIVVVGRQAVETNSYWGVPFIAAPIHEMGHLLQWPHSYSGTSDDQYDNPVEIMSANDLPDGQTYPFAFMTLAANRYSAGWIDPTEVAVVAPGEDTTIELTTYDQPGIKMIAMTGLGPGIFLSLEAHVYNGWDQVPPEYEGVAAYVILQTQEYCGLGYGWCFGIDRVHLQVPASPYGTDHVHVPGDMLRVGDLNMQVLARDGETFTVRVNGPIPRFDDVPFSHGFYDDIEWMAEQEITLGCNADGTLYCPGDSVSRAQMASFLVRALDLPAVAGNRFTDVSGTHLANINALAEAGITLGCTAEGTLYCPNDTVSRAQMGSFLARALMLDPIPGDRFDDMSGTHEPNINAIADAGITLGCNPEGTLYCPNDDVTRGQMAAFLHRALG